MVFTMSVSSSRERYRSRCSTFACDPNQKSLSLALITSRRRPPAARKLHKLLTPHRATRKRATNRRRSAQHASRTDRQRTKLQRASKTRITGKQLVTTKARQRHGHARIFHGFRNHVRVNAVHRRLIECGNRVGQHLEQLFFTEPDLAVVGIESPRNGTRVLLFTQIRLIKHDTKRLRSLRTGLTHQRDEGTRIHSARKKNSERNIAHQMGAN